MTVIVHQKVNIYWNMTVIVYQKVNIYWNMTVIVHQKVNLLKHIKRLFIETWHCLSKS